MDSATIPEAAAVARSAMIAFDAVPADHADAVPVPAVATAVATAVKLRLADAKSAMIAIDAIRQLATSEDASMEATLAASKGKRAAETREAIQVIQAGCRLKDNALEMSCNAHDQLKAAVAKRARLQKTVDDADLARSVALDALPAATAAVSAAEATVLEVDARSKDDMCKGIAMEKTGLAQLSSTVNEEVKSKLALRAVRKHLGLPTD